MTPNESESALASHFLGDYFKNLDDFRFQILTHFDFAKITDHARVFGSLKLWFLWVGPPLWVLKMTLNEPESALAFHFLVDIFRKKSTFFRRNAHQGSIFGPPLWTPKRPSIWMKKWQQVATKHKSTQIDKMRVNAEIIRKFAKKRKSKKKVF